MATAQTVAINGVTPSLLWVALFVVIGVCAALITVLTMIEKIRALKAANDKPQEEASQKVLDMLANDKRRLDAHDVILADMQAQQTILKGKQTSLEKGQRVVCAGVMALLDHTLHNGNTEQMESASSDINKYLLEK